MKVYLINRRDVAVFQGEKQLCVKRKGGAEFVEPVAADGEEITLRFYRRSEFAAKNWWLYVMFFWIIGICGICTPRYGKFVHALDCKVKFTADENGRVDLRFTHYLDEKGQREVPAVENVGSGITEMEGNCYVRDDLALRRRKRYKVLSALARLACFAALVVIVVKAIIG